jgi:hypothetical protein
MTTTAYQVGQAVVLADKTGTMRGEITAVCPTAKESRVIITYRIKVEAGTRVRTFLRTHDEISPAYEIRADEDAARRAVLSDYKRSRRYQPPWAAMRDVQHGVANILASYLDMGLSADDSTIRRLMLQWKMAKHYRAVIDARLEADKPISERSPQAVRWALGYSAR